ncbi:MAG: serine/threonine protein kinase [Planctomycetota bacterium]|nr:MAG: serine/threonine protein kinase [Planctomycetota bacterium]
MMPATALDTWQQRAQDLGALNDATLTIAPSGKPLLLVEAATNPSIDSLATAAAKLPVQTTPRPPDFASTGDQRYTIRALLGSGGMGDVFLAHQHHLEREVAIKLIKAQVNDPRRRAGFDAEVRITSLLEHPGIVPVHDAGDDFYVMKRIQGHTLEQLLREGLTTARVVEVLIRICDTLAFAHDKGIIHRDIKPANIMVGPFGEVLLLDWGLALCVDPERRCQGPQLPHLASIPWAGGGTPAYIAPEMVSGDRQQIGYASDVFLLGATLYRCLAGRAPYRSNDTMAALDAALQAHFPALDDLAPQAPARLRRLAENCMQADPAQRPSLSEVNDILHQWQQHAGASAEAQIAFASAEAEAARAQGLEDTIHAYDAWQQAIASYERAAALDPELASASQRRHAARAAYAQRALSAHDLALAAAIVEREDADEATTPLIEVRAAINQALAQRQRQSRRLRQFTLLSLLFLITTLSLAAYEGWRLAGDAETRARLAQAQAELEASDRQRIQALLAVLDPLLDQGHRPAESAWPLLIHGRQQLDRLVAEVEQRPYLSADLLAAYRRLGSYGLQGLQQSPSQAARDHLQACLDSLQRLLPHLEGQSPPPELDLWRKALELRKD